MKIIRPETFLILISICSILAWDMGDTTKAPTMEPEGYEALLAEKDEEIRNLRAALAAAKQKLAQAGTTTIMVQEVRTIDLRFVNKKKKLFRKIKEKFFEKAAKIKLQLKKIAAILNDKRHKIKSKIRKLWGKEKLYTYNTN